MEYPRCKECNRLFKPASTLSEYCSKACRAKAYKRRRKDRDDTPDTAPDAT